MRIRRSIGSRAARVGTVLAMAAGALVGVATPAFATSQAITVAPAKGPTAGTNTVTLTAGSAPSPAFATTNVVYFSGATCGATVPTTGAVSVTGVAAMYLSSFE